MQRPVLIALLTVTLVISGCAVVEEQPDAVSAAAVRQAAALEQAGQHEAAALAYQQLALQAPLPERQDYLLRAAQLLLDADRLDQSEAILKDIAADARFPHLEIRRQLVWARLELARLQPVPALRRLEPLAVPEADVRLRGDLHETLARAYTLVGNHLEATRERVARDQLPQSPEQQRANQEAIWQSLAALSEQALSRLLFAPPPDPLSGWMELAVIAKRAQLQPEQFAEQFALWRSRYPAHPALPEFLGALAESYKSVVLKPRQIALLLPLSGRFAAAAAAARDGFLAAYYGDTATAEGKPRIRIYDVSAETSWPVYTQAVQNGADLVVGPLDKPSVDVLAAAGEMPVPTLALNYTDRRAPFPKNLIQFGLSPEQEAEQVAQRLWLEGHSNGLALFPDTPWGKRVYEAFRVAWSRLGGNLVEAQPFPGNGRDLSEPVRRLLNVDASQDRYRAIKRLVERKVVFETRRRQDVDFVFLAAFPPQARQLRPQLKFFDAGQIPVYATSHVYSGQIDAARDRDMDGVIFGDMPWTLPPSAELRAAVERNWPESSAQYARLYALGADAYQLVPVLLRLQKFPHEQFSGATGQLRLDADHRVVRQLAWARFVTGVPRLLDTLPGMSGTPENDPSTETLPESRPPFGLP